VAAPLNPRLRFSFTTSSHVFAHLFRFSLPFFSTPLSSLFFLYKPVSLLQPARVAVNDMPAIKPLPSLISQTNPMFGMRVAEWGGAGPY
jgi:hypothetical protein